MNRSLEHAMPCQFCGARHFGLEGWIDDERGEYEAVYCKQCAAAAPFEIWNQRVIGDGGAQRIGGADMTGLTSPGPK